MFIYASYVRAHQHSSGARRGEQRAIGRSRGGATTKIYLACDSHGNPLDIETTGGDAHESQIACRLIEKISKYGQHIICDKGYDSEKISNKVIEQGLMPHIPKHSNNRSENSCFDKELYKHRHLIENLFARLKNFRSIASRHEKLARNFKSIIYMAFFYIWAKIN